MCVQCVGLCSYCDCRTLPVVSRLSCEHVAILEVADRLGALVELNDEAFRESGIRDLLDELATLVMAHGAYEERSLYHELRDDSVFAVTAKSLCGEHLSIHRALQRAVRSAHPTREMIVPALDRLRRHIMKEERGLFPPAVILLSSAAWERAATRA